MQPAATTIQPASSKQQLLYIVCVKTLYIVAGCSDVPAYTIILLLLSPAQVDTSVCCCLEGAQECCRVPTAREELQL